MKMWIDEQRRLRCSWWSISLVKYFLIRAERIGLRLYVVREIEEQHEKLYALDQTEKQGPTWMKVV